MRKLILLMVLALGATTAQAENGLFYLGAGVTNSSLTENVGGYIHTHLKNNSWKAFAGVRPLKWLAVEADYIDLGSGRGDLFGNEVNSTSHADSSAWAAYAVGFLPVPLPVVDFYGKAGVARWNLNSSISLDYANPPYGPFTTSTSSTGTDFAWGIGVQAHFSIAGVRLEYEGFNVHSNYSQVASLSLFLNL
jgi:hypothetical protein